MPNAPADLLTALRAEMARKGVSISALARDAGVSRANLSFHLSGAKLMRLDTAERLAAALGCRLHLARGRAARKPTAP